MTDDIDRSSIDLHSQELWAKYEDIAMHFNDLLMRLRSQSLAGIAALSTLVAVFSKEGVSSIKISWLVSSAIFLAMALFWIAIFCLDILYYNRLLQGAVVAINALERRTREGRAMYIDMSTTIENEFKKPLRDIKPRPNGVLIFYALVFAAILGGAVFSYCMYRQ
jgi:hypothetical protein